MSFVLIIGAKSDIAKALAREYAGHGFDLYLAGRNVIELTDFATDLYIRTQRTVELLELDILDFGSHSYFYEKLKTKPMVVIVAAGYLGDQKKAESEFSEAKHIIDTNFTGIVSFLNIVANDFEVRRSGYIIGISSVAGERGRKKNYTYGAAKAAMTTYLSGLRNRLHNADVHVITVKPGFVNTQMTEGMDLPEKLTAQPGEVARDIYRAQQKASDIVFTKGIWKYIMLIINSLPERIFKRMNI